MGKLSQEHIWKIGQAFMGNKNARKKAVMAEAVKHAPTAESATADTSTDATILIDPEGFFLAPEGMWCYECGSRTHSGMKEQHRKRCMLTQRTAWALERQRELGL